MGFTLGRHEPENVPKRLEMLRRAAMVFGGSDDSISRSDTKFLASLMTDRSTPLPLAAPCHMKADITQVRQKHCQRASPSVLTGTTLKTFLTFLVFLISKFFSQFIPLFLSPDPRGLHEKTVITTSVLKKKDKTPFGKQKTAYTKS